jgi:hypothetical protein
MNNRNTILLALSSVVVGLTAAAWLDEQNPGGPHAPPAASGSRTSTPVLVRAGSTPTPLRPPPTEAATSSAAGVYVPGELMVQVHDIEDAAAVAELVGADLVEARAAGGIVRLALPEDTSLAAARSALLRDERVRSAAPNGRIFGAAKGKGAVKNTTSSDSTTSDSTTSDSTTSDGESSGTMDAAVCTMNLGRGKIHRADSRQWHLGEAKAPEAGQLDLSHYVVAVIDTGVAYENHSDDSGSYVQAPSLAGSAIVAPYDFVNNDAHPNDDHQHGTHIASTIASWGSVEGVAPGAGIMPIKVLDADNSGVESDLIAGIWHAIQNQADVINMSLSFVEGYYPSPALDEALQAASEAGIVLVGAAGNDGANFTTFPAAHRTVISAGAILPGAQQDAPISAAYSNRSARVDIAAPGGVVGDGGLNGIIAETVHPDDPTQVGLWQIAGTSQAAAVTSGAALYVLSTGLPPEQVRAALQAGAYGFQNETHFYEEGLGGGWLRIDKAVEKACNGASGALAPDRFDAAMLMWMTREADGSVAPRARISVVDATGAPAAGVEPYVTIWGTTGESASCVTDSSGVCDLAGPAAAPTSDLAWAFSLDAVVESGVGVRPGNLLFGSDALEILLAGLADEDVKHDGIAIHWRDVVDPDLGDLVEGYTVMNAGTGLSSSPLGVVFLPSSPNIQHDNATVEVELDGTGLSSSPLGLFPLTILRMDGTGLSSSPLGFTSLRLAVLDGTGLSSSPLGLTATTLYSPAPGAHDSDLLSFEGSQVDLSTGTVNVDATGSNIGALVESGGHQTDAGYPIASTLLGSGVVSAPSASVSAYPSGHGAEDL